MDDDRFDAMRVARFGAHGDAQPLAPGAFGQDLDVHFPAEEFAQAIGTVELEPGKVAEAVEQQADHFSGAASRSRGRPVARMFATSVALGIVQNSDRIPAEARDPASDLLNVTMKNRVPAIVPGDAPFDPPEHRQQALLGAEQLPLRLHRNADLERAEDAPPFHFPGDRRSCADFSAVGLRLGRRTRTVVAESVGDLARNDGEVSTSRERRRQIDGYQPGVIRSDAFRDGDEGDAARLARKCVSVGARNPWQGVHAAGLSQDRVRAGPGR